MRRFSVWNLVTTLSVVIVVGSMPKNVKVKHMRIPRIKIAANKMTMIMMWYWPTYVETGRIIMVMKTTLETIIAIVLKMQEIT